MAIDLEHLGRELLKNEGTALDEWFRKHFDTRFDEKMAEIEANKTPSISIMVTKGTLDWAYPPFIIASTAAALGWQVSMFFTFYGLGLLKKDLDLEISPLGNPAMPMKMPFGPQWFQGIEWNIPNLIMAGVPGFEKLATSLMKQTIRNKGVAPVEELRSVCIESEVELVACQMTVDLFGWTREEFIPEVSEWAGAATYLGTAQKADVSLYM